MSIQLGVVVPRDLPAREFVTFVKRVEQYGFADIWVVEDLGFHGGIAQAATALAETSAVHVGIGILPAGVRNVAYLATEIATLAQLHPGRFSVGVGHGMPSWMRRTGTSVGSSLTLLSETIRCLRRLLRGEVVTYNGDYVRLENVALEEALVSPPPILAGVRGPKSLALAGSIADGTILAEPSPPSYVRAARAQMGEVGEGYQVVAYNLAAITEDLGRGRECVRRRAVDFAQADWAAQIATMPFAAEFRELLESCGSNDELAARMPASWLIELGIVGDAATGRRRLYELVEAGVTRPVLMGVAADPIAELASFRQLLT